MEDYSAILREIKSGKTCPVYFCAGQNRFFFERFVHGLKEILFGGGPLDFNYESINAALRKTGEIIDSANQLPVFAKKRLVVADGFKFSKGKDEEILGAYLANPSGSTVLVIQSEEAKLPAWVVKASSKNSRTVPMKDPYDRELPYWIKEISKSYGKEIEGGVSEYLSAYVGNDLKRIDAEIQKLANFVGERRAITLKDMDALVCDSKVETIFAFIDSLSARNLSSALRMLDKIVKTGEIPTRIIVMLSRHYRILWKIKRGVSRGMKHGELAQLAGVSVYYLPKYVEHAGSFSYKNLAKVIALLARIDIELKTIGISKKLLLEKLCLDLAGV